MLLKNNCVEQIIFIETEFVVYSFINESKFQVCHNFNVIRYYVSKLFDVFTQSILRKLLCNIN